MDSEYIQLVRAKLQKRLKRLNSANEESFKFILVQTWIFLQENEIIKGILDDLERRVPEAKGWADTIIQEGCPVYASTELGSNAISYWLIKACIAKPFANEAEEQLWKNETEQLLRDKSGFLECYVEPLFDHIEEQIDDRRMTLALLRKYKHRCEWFRREELNLVSKEGETTLVYDLYEYLHDQGLQFHIEPKSVSGRVDLISAQSGKDRLVADAKIFNPEGSSKSSHIVAGFRQVYEYTKDFNEPFGYLVIFKTCEGDLSIPTINEESGIRFITHNNKTVFLVIIDIFDYSKSASERGKLKTYEILPSQFIASLSEPISSNETK